MSLRATPTCIIDKAAVNIGVAKQPRPLAHGHRQIAELLRALSAKGERAPRNDIEKAVC
jgi:hypothetical protein